jgi:hypothetical protein
MLNRSKTHSGVKKPVNFDRLIAQILARYSHLYIDIALCVAILVAIFCMVAAARALDDWLPLGI